MESTETIKGKKQKHCCIKSIVIILALKELKKTVLFTEIYKIIEILNTFAVASGQILFSPNPIWTLSITSSSLSAVMHQALF